MASVEVSEKIETAPNVDTNKTPPEVTTETYDVQNHESEGLHFVTRGKVVEDNDASDGTITGYHADQMRSRALLSYKEERRLFWKIDWHLMPLMSIIYLLKNLDAANVCYTPSWVDGQGQH